jgi:uncharacterized radical SAM superfamily Fe-S cluster-containing enzyme
LPETLERRLTFPDVIREIARQTDGLFREDDFMPLPCAHPNCHSLSYAYRSGCQVVPLSRFIDARKHLDLLANGITFTRVRARELIEQYLGSSGCCGGKCGPEAVELNGHFNSRGGAEDAEMTDKNSNSAVSASPRETRAVDSLADEFFSRAMTERLSPADVFRITITSFLDAYNFDVRRLMKCCIHHVLPSGHVIPFCAFNVLYRNGHVPLPQLREIAASVP